VRLGHRERQILDALYRLGEATVAQVVATIDRPPTYSAVRGMLNLLLSKGVVEYRQEGKRYVYRPVEPRGKVRRSALRNVIRNFFGGEPVDAFAALLDGSAGQLSDEDLQRVKQLIVQAEQRRPPESKS
jgi:predicted transcriptional regulator